MGIDEEITFIQASLKTLRFDYDLFFSGAAKFPPFKLRTELEKRVRKLGNEPIDKLAVRFKLQSVMTSYNSCIALWEKQMKLRESGIRDPRLAAAVRAGKQAIAALDSGRAEVKPPAGANDDAEDSLSADELAEMEKSAAAALKPARTAPPAQEPAIIQAPGKAAPGKSGTAFKIGNRNAAPPAAAAPYAQLFEEFSKLKRETGEKPGYDLEKFSVMMEKKKSELQAKGLKTVDFGVQIKDGKVILKAKSQSGVK